MNKVFMLTKANCPQCQSLKMFLKLALRDKYANDITQVNQEENLELYTKLVTEHQVLSLPALISGEEVLRKCEPTPTIAFLEKHIGKR
jgi:glutaredoxin-like protein NrdH